MKKYVLFFIGLSFCFGQNKNHFTHDQLTGQIEKYMIKNQNYQLLPEVSKSFELMKTAALKDSIKIKIVSGFRSFNQQRKIWNRKFRKNNSMGLTANDNITKIIEYSTIPGTSRHHWGTDIDIIDDNFEPKGDVLLPEKFYNNGPYEKLKNWMDDNSEKFGFFLVYTNNLNRTGFKHEPWHYSYSPISKNILRNLLELNFRKLFIKKKVLGSKNMTPEFIDYYKNEFLLGINHDLKNVVFNE